MPTKKEKVALIRAACKEHNDKWDTAQPTLAKLRNAYLCKFWEGENWDNTNIRVEVADAYAYVEGFIASLFSSHPAIEAEADIQEDGDAELVKEITNRFLYNTQVQFESASRMALIYPCAFFKLAPREGDNLKIVDKIEVRAVPAWEVIVDTEANSWESQRFVAHSYYLPVSEARKKWGNKKFSTTSKLDFFDDVTGTANESGDDSLPDDFQFIQLVEFYDFLNDRLYFYSPNWGNGQELLEDTVIPVRAFDDSPLSTIVPLYYSRVPEKPLEGVSTLARVYDQVFEKNILRSFWANAVRRDSRQFLYKEGAIDEEALTQITAGVDGAFIPVDAETLSGIIAEVPVTPLSSNFSNYLAAIENDLAKGSVMAPFTRGETSKATATEISALAHYTSSEIGRLAKERDYSTQMVATVYVSMLQLFLEDTDEDEVVVVDGKVRTMSPSDFAGKFKFVAADRAATPLVEEAKKKQLLELIPVVAQLGVPPDTILEQVVKMFDLPATFLEKPEPEPAPELPAAAPEGAPPNPDEVAMAQAELNAQAQDIRGGLM